MEITLTGFEVAAGICLLAAAFGLGYVFRIYAEFREERRDEAD